ncbi:MAG: aldehyde dehydrogenase family protein, partial [Pseudonocardiaceae bacterium]
MVGRISHWIDGKPWAGVAQRGGDVFDPATGLVTARVDFATTREVDDAVSAAAMAFPGWRDTSLAARSNVLFAFRELLSARKMRLAEIVTAEHGKVLDDAAGEVQRALEAVEFACGVPTQLKGGFSENVSTGVDVYSIRQPLGVVGVISPFN